MAGKCYEGDTKDWLSFEKILFHLTYSRVTGQVDFTRVNQTL
jgi:hypothetical protein